MIKEKQSMDDRARINAECYYGRLWREHAANMNHLMTNSDNVLLMKSIKQERIVVIYQAVDTVSEPNGAQGGVIAHVFSVKENSADDFVRKAEPIFADYRCAFFFKLKTAYDLPK